MAQIGQFTRTETGFVGQLHTLILYRELTLVPAAPSESDNAPDYRIHHGGDDGPEIGAGWKRTGEKAGEYISLQIDDPTFALPIRANLFETDAEDRHWVLHWNRPAKRPEKRDDRG